MAMWAWGTYLVHLAEQAELGKYSKQPMLQSNEQKSQPVGIRGATARVCNGWQPRHAEIYDNGQHALTARLHAQAFPKLDKYIGCLSWSSMLQMQPKIQTTITSYVP